MKETARKLPPLPPGFRVAVDSDVKPLSDELLFGGSPARVLRLTKAGRKAWQELATGPVVTAAAGILARRLTDAGLAHPVPPEPAGEPDLTVVVPAHNRAAVLERCLAGLGGIYPVLVVDDGSEDAAQVAAVAAKHGAKLVRRDGNGGPGAARNTGLAHVGTELVAFVDSDCRPEGAWMARLAAHFADPLVAAVAPRIRGLAGRTWAGRYTRAASSLDLGESAARVAPGSRISYVPTAALIVRRSALATVGDAAFDPRLRFGEDVDLVWRLHKAGYRIRYDPSVHVDHEEPTTWRGLLARRYRYGTSAAPLALRHPDSIAPLVLQPWPALTVAAALARRPLLAVAAFAGAVLGMRDTLRAGGVPTTVATRAMGVAVRQTGLGCGRYGTQFAGPALVAALAGRHRLAAAALLLAAPLSAWCDRRPPLDPVRYTAAAIADDVAYGAGVLAGALTHRTTIPLRPRLARRPPRVDRKGKR
ncbi:MAG TPA: mycofactocin biosynthesis glycosyltransferase MftF [Amycolatopsis sp.]|nr:mycofactocin biosynthesis glycosyltransferase MftF [Amycolatopsis sp.]